MCLWELLQFQDRQLGYGGSSEPSLHTAKLLVYAVKPARLPPSEPRQPVKFWSLAQPGWCAYLERQQRFQKPPPQNQGWSCSLQRRELCRPGHATSPYLVLGQGDPGAEILLIGLSAKRNLSSPPTAQGLDLASPTLIPHYIPFLASHLASILEEKARGDSGLLVVKWGSILSGLGRASQGPLSVSRCLPSPPQSRLCSKASTLTKITLVGWALCTPLLPYGTENHDVLKQSEGKDKIV